MMVNVFVPVLNVVMPMAVHLRLLLPAPMVLVLGVVVLAHPLQHVVRLYVLMARAELLVLLTYYLMDAVTAQDAQI
jgi:hypothetical protein